MNELPDDDKLPEAEQEQIMNVSFFIGKNAVLIASEIFPPMGQKCRTKEIIQTSSYTWIPGNKR